MCHFCPFFSCLGGIDCLSLLAFLLSPGANKNWQRVWEVKGKMDRAGEVKDEDEVSGRASSSSSQRRPMDVWVCICWTNCLSLLSFLLSLDANRI